MSVDDYGYYEQNKLRIMDYRDKPESQMKYFLSKSTTKFNVLIWIQIGCLRGLMLT